MKNINVNVIEKEIARMCQRANYKLPSDIKDSLKKGLQNEQSPIGKNLLKDILHNGEIAEKEKIPLCQDTGMVVLFVEIGQEVHIEGGSLETALQRGVKKGYKEGYLRKSVVSCPLLRNNTGDNTPAVIHYKVVEGEDLKITLIPKGFGSENMSAIKMLKPSDGEEGIIDFVVETVEKAGANACPPIIVGIGIGGTMEKAALLSKESLSKPLENNNKESHVKKLEEVLLNKINDLGIGPQGLGGTTTALGVHIETYPTHIAGLPVAVNISCHASRHEQIIL